MIHGLSPDEGDTKKQYEASWFMAQYLYRKIFGLSWKEFNEEPMFIYLMNEMIDTIISQAKNKK